MCVGRVATVVFAGAARLCKMNGMSNGFDDFYAIIPAGGTGTRLWPLSREGRPKFLFDMLGQGRTLIQTTFDRLAAICGIDHVCVSTGERHVAAVREQLPELSAEHIFAEPSPRDSTAAIALATAVLMRRHGDDIIVGSFAADHVIRGRLAFIEAVRQAVQTARAGYVTTIGIAASRPSTAFGYIHEGGSLAARIPDAPDATLVERFVEKPNAVTAQAYLSTGEYRWNAGMFVMRASVLMDHLHKEKPRLARAIDAIADAIVDDDHAYAAAVETARANGENPRESVHREDFHSHRDAAMAQHWPSLEKIAFDYAVAEPLSVEGGVAMIPGDFGWDDVGDFNSVAALLPSVDERNNKVLGSLDDVATLDSAGDVIVTGGERTIALLGVNDMVVVDTPDALLVAPRARSQEVKAMVKHLAESGADELL